MREAIVVGYDGSAQSAAAVRWAALAARRRDCPLDVVHAWGFGGREGGGAGGSWLGEQVLESVRKVAADGTQVARDMAPGVEARAVLDHGSPVSVLARHGAQAPLIVIGRHGAGARGGAMIGTVTSGVLHNAPTQVAVIPEDHIPESGPVVVGFDGSPASFLALEAGCEAAELVGQELHVVVAWTPTPETVIPAMRAQRFMEATDGAQVAAQQVLDQARRWCSTRPELRGSATLAVGRAAEVLVKHSRNAALVVVGTRGRGGFVSLVLGSVSRTVVHRAHCPVLVTRDPEAVRLAVGEQTAAATE